MRRGLCVLGLVLLTACGTAPAPAPTAVRAPATPVTVGGATGLKSPPFTLAGGNYTIVWAAARTTLGGGNFAADLVPVGGSVLSRQAIANTIIPEGQPQSGSTAVYGLAGGQWYVDATIAPGTWSVTLTELRP